MHSPSCLISALGLAALAAARRCTNLSVPVHVQARNAVFNLTTPQSDIDVINFVLDNTQNGHNFTAELLTGYADVGGQYTITATYCEPDNGPSGTVQLLTHGIGFDRSYWDLPVNNFNYSYVAQANAAGYSTFSYDRLGIGMSSRGEPVNEIQSSLEIAALYELTVRLRAGSIKGVGCGFDKVVHVGHSFGSIQSYSLTVLYPHASDGLVLTGFTQAANFVPYFNLGGNFVLATEVPALSSYPVGYFAAGDISGVQTNFFAPGMFDPELLNLAYTTGEPVTPGELLTIGAQTSSVNPTTAPVLIITGGRDIPFCGGDCRVTTNASIPNVLEMSRAEFPNTTNFTAVVVGEAGHGLNLEYSHPFTYSTILDFVEQNVGAA
ncbi:alpha/beta-hydrolase [Cryphonectria parasitica EP155]|uniref:Alpha/beta-hydrolase n=1 Tax=Cryphonectria parasitica (strain ATCC 38755 / EP155) TaxID=660469 RepID=A0A9P4XTD2_CRYP1|nr:alpha/beta-hydrolase [Cryphonectria parasitica EP155]KAF3760561.1 alpha/beta-hydrolase [Cryphonectria parasitica EP155]